MDAAVPAFTAAFFATCGWLYTARRARGFSRKQHTVTVMLQASFNSEFQGYMKTIGDHIRSNGDPKAITSDEALQVAARRTLNHYEFIAAGLRNGDFDEKLVKDSERSTILELYTACENYIWVLRNSRKRMSMYEHLEWLHARWTERDPQYGKRFIERIMQKPFQGKRHDPHKGIAG